MSRGIPRSFAAIAATLLTGVCGITASGQVAPSALPSAAPSASLSPLPGASTLPVSPSAGGASAPAEASPPGTVSATPTATPTPVPTQPPIIVEPPSAGIVPGGNQVLRVESVLGTVAVTVADPNIVDVSIDQVDRTITLTGKQLGMTTLTVRDDRGLTRDVPVRVANLAGTVADSVTIRVTGDPATPIFLQEQALNAALAAAQPRPGAQIIATPDSVNISQPLTIDNTTTIDVPMIIQGSDYFTVQSVTHVNVENVALPRIHPSYLMVSDFPETLKENGLLFEATLTSSQPARFLYYHFNPAGQPDRRIVLRLHNASSQPANVQFISGMAGPEVNDMEVGHLSTARFLVREANNEGNVLTIAPGDNVTILAQSLPAQNIVSNLVQVREISGAPLHLTLIAQNAADPIDAPEQETQLLVGDVLHARGVYPIPEFYFDYQYDTSGPDLEIPIGQIPVPELKEGEALAGDYGVLQSVTVRIVNPDSHNAASIAVYANPRGGRATGTFIIDGVLLQAHALPPFGHYKLREYTIPPGGFIRTTIVTMPEGGSSYPLRLDFATDDGSTSPGAPNSLIY
ncbi:MAG TPA: pilus assembly protein N-terminal domain-containing protein [Candidatus Baltobacteraceae bacterium]